MPIPLMYIKQILPSLKTTLKRLLYQAEIKSSLSNDDINNIVNVISDALKKAAYNSGMGKSLKKNEIKTKTNTAQTMV